MDASRKNRQQSSRVFLVYKGFHGVAERVGEDQYRGAIVNVTEPVDISGTGLHRIQSEFTWTVERLIKEGVQPGPAPDIGPRRH